MKASKQLRKELSQHLNLFYKLANTWYPSMPNSYTQAYEVDDLAMDFVARVLRRSEAWDPERGGITNFITMVSNSYALDTIRRHHRQPNICVSVDEFFITLEPSYTRIPREPSMLRQIQDFHISLGRDLFSFVEDLIAGDYVGKAHTKDFKRYSAELLQKLLVSGIPLDTYQKMLLHEM